MKREKQKESTKYAFAFEEFIATNDIQIKELPDYMQTMIRTITKQRLDTEKNCTEAHRKVILNKLKRFADIVEDFLMNFYDERLANNIIKAEKQADEEEKQKISKADEIINLAEYYGRNYLLSSELKQLGVEVDYSKKEIFIDQLRLERELTTAKWYLGINQNYKEVQP